jgi:ECF transporter S component (folate family)
MVIEAFTIDLVIFKINFAFLAIAVIGMLFGPTVSLVAGFACDIVGFVVHPQGGFIPTYILVAGLQGLIYGIVLYHKKDKFSFLLKNNKTDKLTDITLHIRAIIARVIDVNTIGTITSCSEFINS